MALPGYASVMINEGHNLDTYYILTEVKNTIDKALRRK